MCLSSHLNLNEFIKYHYIWYISDKNTYLIIPHYRIKITFLRFPLQSQWSAINLCEIKQILIIHGYIFLLGLYSLQWWKNPERKPTKNYCDKNCSFNTPSRKTKQKKNSKFAFWMVLFFQSNFFSWILKEVCDLLFTYQLLAE